MSRYFHLDANEGVMLISNTPNVLTLAASNPLYYRDSLQFHSEFPYLQYARTLPSSPITISLSSATTQTFTEVIDDSCC